MGSDTRHCLLHGEIPKEQVKPVAQCGEAHVDSPDGMEPHLLINGMLCEPDIFEGADAAPEEEMAELQ